MATNNYCISVDWLQIYGTRNLDPIPVTLYGLGRNYDVKERDIPTSIWTEVYDIEHRGREVATFYRCPRSSALDKFGCTLKLANRVLYCKEFVGILYQLLDLLNIRYQGITRLDLAYDCNTLYGGRSVPELLMDFFSHQPFCEGHIVRKGSRKVQVIGSRSNLGVTRISGMRWGSPQSDIGAYCYNKSLELLEVKDKPWIRDVWVENGLVNLWNKAQFDAMPESKRKKLITLGDSEDFVQVPVWRFEISIKGHAKDLLEINTGELFKLNLDYLNSQTKIENLFYTYAARVFDFRISTGQSQIKNYKPLQLFERVTAVTQKPIQLNMFADTGRTEKIVVNKLEQLRETYSDIAGVNDHALEVALQFVRTVSGHKAALVRLQKEAQYLANIKGFKFYEEKDFTWLQFVDYVHKQRLDTVNASALPFYDSLFTAVLDEIRREECSHAESLIVIPPSDSAGAAPTRQPSMID